MDYNSYCLLPQTKQSRSDKLQKLQLAIVERDLTSESASTFLLLHPITHLVLLFCPLIIHVPFIILYLYHIIPSSPT